MNKFNKNIPAFTLLELLVTLTLTTLIVSLSYFTYNYLLSGYYKYSDINDKINQHCQLRTELDHLMYHSESIQRKGTAILFMLPNNKSVRMEVNENNIILQDEHNNTLDTLKLPISSARLYWNTDSLVPDGGPLQKIKLNIIFSNQPYTLIFEKPYDSEKFIQLDSLYESLKSD